MQIFLWSINKSAENLQIWCGKIRRRGGWLGLGLTPSKFFSWIQWSIPNLSPNPWEVFKIFGHSNFLNRDSQMLWIIVLNLDSQSFQILIHKCLETRLTNSLNHDLVMESRFRVSSEQDFFSNSSRYTESIAESTENSQIWGDTPQTMVRVSLGVKKCLECDFFQGLIPNSWKFGESEVIWFCSHCYG